MTFDTVIIQGGGELEIDSGGEGMTLYGNTFHVESGGIVKADHVTIIVQNLVVDDSAVIVADNKV